MQRLFVLPFTLVLVLWNCQKRDKNADYYPPKLYQLPSSKPLKLDSGYSYKVFTKDSIQPIIAANGDTIVTGKQIRLKGKRRPFTLHTTSRIPVKIHSLEVGPQRTLLKQPRQYAYTITQTQNPHFHLINTLGDTISTGKPIPFVGQKQVIKSPAPIEVLPLRDDEKASLNLQNLDVAQNLLSSTVYALTSGNQGALWMGTYDGISHYNGVDVVHYTQEQGLPAGNIRAIFEDSKGTIWFNAYGHSLCKYDGDSLTVFPASNSLIGKKLIRSIVEDRQGNIWWTSPQAVIKYDGKFATCYTIKEGLTSNKIETIYADSQGNIWIGTRQGINCLSDDKIITYQLEGFAASSISTIFEDAQHHIWFGTSTQGLLKYDGKVFTHYGQENGLPSNAIRAISQDAQGNLWVALLNQGLAVFDGKHFTHYTETEGLPDNIISDILIDEQDQLWLATIAHGVVKIHLSTFTTPKLPLPQTGLTMKAFDKDSKGNLWLATESLGLLQFDGTSWSHHTHPLLASTYFTEALLIDRADNIWQGTYRGLIKHQEGQLQHYLPEVQITSLLEDSSGNLWIGSFNQGIFKFDGQQLIQYTQNDGLLYNAINTLIEDHQGNIWISSMAGLSKFDGTYLINYSLKEGLSSSRIGPLWEDGRHQLWVGTIDRGLMQFDGKKITYFTKKEGLPHNRIASIIEDHQGNIWVGTGKGLACLKQQKNRTSQDSSESKFLVQSYGREQGLQEPDFIRSSAHLDKQKHLWWGTIKDVTYLDLRRFKSTKTRLSVSIKDVLLNEKVLNYRQLNDSLKKTIYFDSITPFTNTPQGLSVPYLYNHFTFRFTTSGLQVKSKLHYTHRIKELNEPWSRPSKDAKVDYRNLPSGTFTLQVKAINERQQWSKVFTYTFTIRPPWWQAWWFKTMLMVLVSMLLVTYHRRRLYLAKKRQVVLEKVVAQKTNELNLKNEELSHKNNELCVKNEELALAKEKERDILEQAMKSKELRFLAAVQLFDEKHKALANLEEQLNVAIEKNSPTQLQKVKTNFKNVIRSIASIDILSESIESKYPKMLEALTKEFPDLSRNEIKHCLLIKLNCSTKEAAQLLGVSPNAVSMAKKRLKKKLGLSEEISLYSFLQKSLV